MKLTACFSIEFSEEMKKVCDSLTAQGHEVLMPHYAKKILDGEISLEEYKRVKDAGGDTSFREAADENLIMKHYRKIVSSDGVFILNVDKKGVKNYIGGNTFLEMGFAHVLGKKIFVMNPLPDMPYSDELKEMDTVVLDGDLSKVK